MTTFLKNRQKTQEFAYILGKFVLYVKKLSPLGWLN